eukprot:66068-Chlamydomonas_euryale.AAC.1
MALTAAMGRASTARRDCASARVLLVCAACCLAASSWLPHAAAQNAAGGAGGALLDRPGQASRSRHNGCPVVTSRSC